MGGSEEGRADMADDSIGGDPGSYEETRYLGRKGTERRLEKPHRKLASYCMHLPRMMLPLIPSKWRSGTDEAISQEKETP